MEIGDIVVIKYSKPFSHHFNIGDVGIITAINKDTFDVKCKNLEQSLIQEEFQLLFNFFEDVIKEDGWVYSVYQDIHTFLQKIYDYNNKDHFLKASLDLDDNEFEEEIDGQKITIGNNSALTFIRRITPEELLTVKKFSNKEHNNLDEIYPLL